MYTEQIAVSVYIFDGNQDAKMEFRVRVSS